MSLPAGRTSVRRARSRGDRITQTRGFEGLARTGIATRGVVYAVIALLAIKLALGDGGKATNQQGALSTIAKQPFGKALLVVVAVGLAGYALWRLARAVLGHGVETTDGAKERIDGLVSGVGYALLCVTAISILAGSGGGSGGGSPDQTTGGVLGWPGGQVLVAIAGLVIIGVGLEQGYKGVRKKFLENSRTERMSEGVERSFTALGVAGHLARMVVFALIGYFLLRAAIEYDPDKAVSLDGALTAVAHASYGPALLGLVAAGLLAFAAYSVADARYRKV